MTGALNLDPAYFRQVLSHLPTGVTVITGYGSDGPSGMAANSVTSVSLEPPLVLFCPAHSSTTWPRIRQSGAFCINIMANNHEPLIRQFSLRDAQRFAGVEWEDRETGPALQGAVGWIECRIQNEITAGDHMVVIGAVVGIEARSEVEPLVLCRGRYGSFQYRSESS